MEAPPTPWRQLGEPSLPEEPSTAAEGPEGEVEKDKEHEPASGDAMEE